ncbi:MAG: Fe-S-cluster-containing dehydrogenase component [Planctomycetota bacterium]|jgi:Fe-S-cluster-containing dehydrogenase component
MVQLGFVIDHSRCIGCHACTVACKSENDVPLGDFRTWVKYTEAGEFPDVRRSFTVLRCNQCTDAPCMTICPTSALHKRPDGIVDVEKDACIGCKSCMQACPYDALYIDKRSGTANKCHFCAHRTERGLAPACAVVCPTEALIPGDFDDPDSVVSKMKSSGQLTARKTELNTKPNVWYRDVSDHGIDPLTTNAAGGYLWANQKPGDPLEAERFLAKAEEKAEARTVYNVDHAPLWGPKVSAYLFTKSLAAGAFLAGAITAVQADFNFTGTATWLVPMFAMLFLLATLLLLVVDLKQPKRFFMILTRPNWKSWVAKGAIVLTAYAVLLTAWIGIGLFDIAIGETLGAVLIGATAITAALTACYTAWLFGQATGRVLWLKKGFALHLIIQAIVAGSAGLLLLSTFLDLDTPTLVNALRVGLIGHFAMMLAEKNLSPTGREKEYHRVVSLISHGPFAKRHLMLGIILGVGIPLALSGATSPIALGVAAICAMIGLYSEEDILVRAGQALPIS